MRGNIADRLRQGAVTDFLDLYWRDWRWQEKHRVRTLPAAGAEEDILDLGSAA